MGESVAFASNGGEDRGWLAVPASGHGPGVIVIQEWWGLVDHIKDVCERFAAAGFVALAPDLYQGTATKEPDEAMKLMMTLNMAQAVRNMSGAVDYLRSHAAVSGHGLGAVGFCMGGGLALRLALERPDAIRAAVPFYGAVPQQADPHDWTRMTAAVQGHYAEHDDIDGLQVAQALGANARETGKSVEIFVYPGTRHAFFNDTRPEVYDRAAAALAWDRTIRFLKEQLA